MRSLYAEEPTWLRRLPAGAKLFVLSAGGTVLVVIQRPGILLALCGLALLTFVSLGRPAWRRLHLLGAMVIAAALIVGCHALLGSPMLGVVGALRLCTATLLALMLTLTTKFDDLLAILEVGLRPLQRFGLPVDRVALGIGLTLRFAENFHLQWQRLDDAYRLRAGRAGGLRLLAPLTICTLQTAERVADALAMRLGR
jgi:biotin transport system permease protein